MRTPHTPEPGLNAWIITQDFVADNEWINEGVMRNTHAIGMTSHHCPVPEKVLEDLQAQFNTYGPQKAACYLANWALDAGLTQLFRLYDDDGILQYEGYMKPFDQITSDNADGFEPLEDFGMPNAGCTELRYWLNVADVPNEKIINPRTRGWHTL